VLAELHPHFCDCLDCMGGVPAVATATVPIPLVVAGAAERARHLTSLRAAAARRRERLREIRSQQGGAS
jgi:hypothetical protein